MIYDKKILGQGHIRINTSQDEEEFEEKEYEVYLVVGDHVQIKPSYEIGCGLDGGNNHSVYHIVDNTKVKEVRRDNYEPLLEEDMSYGDYMVTVDKENSTDAKILEDIGFTITRREHIPSRV